MKANTLTPTEIFGNQIRYVVPLYQRPYVWNRADQWEPLWEDIRTLAEKVLEHPGGFGLPAVSPHFLGAIVLDQQLNAVNLIGSRAVIDGQQRLTTLQLMLDAAQLVIAEHGRVMDGESMRVLVENNAAMVTDSDHVFKVWPTDRDQDAFRAAMDNNATPSGPQLDSSIVKAHAYFESVMREWVTQTSERTAEDRAGALATALRQHLRLVVIDLEPGDNAQVIFETLNHRGAPAPGRRPDQEPGLPDGRGPRPRLLRALRRLLEGARQRLLAPAGRTGSALPPEDRRLHAPLAHDDPAPRGQGRPRLH